MRCIVQQPARVPADGGGVTGSAEPYEAAPAGGPAVRGVLHRPAGPAGDSVVLAHGAGGNSGAPLLVALRLALALIPAPTTLVAVAGAAHDLGGGRGAAADAVSRAVVAFLGRPA